MAWSTGRRLLLGAAASLLLAPPLLASPAESSRQRTPPPPSVGAIDVTGVTLSDLLRLYFGQIDKRPYAVCSEAVGDMRRVTVRADASLTYPALRQVLKMHGYAMKESAGMIVVCDAASLAAKPAIEPYGPPTPSQVPVYASEPVRTVPVADGSPLRRASDVDADPVAARPAVPAEPIEPRVIRTYRPSFRTVGSLLPALAQAGYGRFLNVSGAGGAPTTASANTTFSNAPTQGTYAQTGDDTIVWSGTEDQWTSVCELLDALDAPLPKAKVDVYAVAVTDAQGTSDSVALLGRAAGVGFGVGQAQANSVSVGIGALSAVLSSVRTSEHAKVLQHYSAQLVHGQQQIMRSGSQVPVSGDIVDLEGGKTRQSQDYRPIGVNVTIMPSIMRSSVQLGFSVEISSVTSQLSSQNINPTFSSDTVQTTLDVKPGTVSFVSALALTSQGQSRERFFFIPIGRTMSKRVSDIVYMIAVSDIEEPAARAPRSACAARSAGGRIEEGGKVIPVDKVTSPPRARS